jgi:hypothetical protein
MSTGEEKVPAVSERELLVPSDLVISLLCMTRLLSWTEIDTAMTCWARWDFAYGGRLAGSTLKPKELAPILSEGRAWGAAVAAWHQHGNEVTALWDAHRALRASLDEDEQEIREAGMPVSLEARVEMENRLGAMLDHYAETAHPIPGLRRIEGEIVVKLPSRGGQRSSSVYGFQCFLDGYTDEDGERWVVEFKLRNRLTDAVLLERQRQPRWYAWAEARAGKRQPLGVIVDERLNDLPKEPRVLKSGKPSHAKDQMTTPEAYAQVCHAAGELPRLDVVQHLRQRQWQQRFPLMFRPGELAEAGQELVSAARLIRDLDSGLLQPIRNAKRANCDYCRFREICTEPADTIMVDALFRRTEPKRLREPA